MRFKHIIFTAACLCFLTISSCKKEAESPQTSNVDCDSKSIQIAFAVDDAIKCNADGKITVTASGSTGFTYQMGSGSFGSNNVFDNLAAGTYSFTVKDADGCTKSGTADVTESGTKGANFTIVSNLIETKCNQVCHNSGAGGAPKGIFATECNIISRKATIKLKAVDEGMGSLNSTEKGQITAWINAGGTYVD